MSSAQPPNPPPPENNNPNDEKKQEPEASSSSPAQAEDASAAMDTDEQPAEEKWDDIPEDVLVLPTEDILTRTRLIET